MEGNSNQIKKLKINSPFQLTVIIRVLLANE